MNFKKIFLGCCLLITCGLIASEFVLSKADQNQVKPAKKSRELIIEQIGDILKNLLKHDRDSLELRAYFQEELENILEGEDGSLVSSSSKSKLQEILKILEELNAKLVNQVTEIKELRIKIKNLKAEKLKGS